MSAQQRTATPSSGSHDSTPLFGYFMLHAESTGATGEGSLNMVLEDLRSGLKRTFRGADELRNFLEQWSRRVQDRPSDRSSDAGEGAQLHPGDTP